MQWGWGFSHSVDSYEQLESLELLFKLKVLQIRFYSFQQQKTIQTSFACKESKVKAILYVKMAGTLAHCTSLSV